MPRRPSSSGEVLRLIRAEQVDTRAEIGRRTGLSRPAVALRVAELVANGLVAEHADGASTGGRPPTRLTFNAAGGAVLIASLGRTRGQVAVCDLDGTVLVQIETALEFERGPDVVLPWLLDRWDELLAKAGFEHVAVRGVGIGIPDTVEFAAGRSLASPSMPRWGGVEIRSIVAERYPVPVYLDNEVNVLALGEYYAGYRGDVEDFVFVKASAGIGAAVICGGLIQRGALGAAGEIGHIPVRDGGEVRCRCGNLGCVEAAAGGAALVARLAGRGRDVTDLAGVTALARSGDTEAVCVVREAGRLLGEVIAATVNLLNPAVVVLGGDLARAYDPLIAGVREVVYRRATALATRHLRIEASRLGDTAGLVGCAALICEHIFTPEAVDAALVRTS
jgi:predicted NBD/HSP70 family sugar kinase